MRAHVELDVMVPELAYAPDTIRTIESVGATVGTQGAIAAADMLVQSYRMWVRQASEEMRARMIRRGAVPTSDSPTGLVIQKGSDGHLMSFDFEPVGVLGLPHCVDFWSGSEQWGSRISRKTAISLIGPDAMARLGA